MTPSLAILRGNDAASAGARPRERRLHLGRLPREQRGGEREGGALHRAPPNSGPKSAEDAAMGDDVSRSHARIRSTPLA